jgi:hypothetical protein
MHNERRGNENHVPSPPTPPAAFPALEVILVNRRPFDSPWVILGALFFIYMMLVIFGR